MKCLVTGAGGLLGFEICQQLKEQGHEVWAIDSGFRSQLRPPCDHWYPENLITALFHVPKDFDVVYHMAAINGTDYFYSMPLTVLTNNIQCDLLVFEWAQQCTNLKSLVYASSSEIVAGSNEDGIPEKVDILIKDIHNPRWSYRLAKIASENYLHNSNLPWIAVRYFNVYGAHSRAGHFVADQIDNQLNGVFQIIGPDESRSFCYVSDAMSATINLVGKVNQEVINVGTSEETNILEGANIICQELGFSNPKWNFIQGRNGSSSKRVPNLSKLCSILPAYKPRSFREGIVETIRLRNLNS